MPSIIFKALLVGAGGFAGSITRYLISVVCDGRDFTGFPAATFIVNALGSLAIGIFLSMAEKEVWIFLLTVGFCGGFTTFSSFSAEALHLIKSGNAFMSIVYIFASVAVCLLATWAGLTIGTKLKI